MYWLCLQCDMEQNHAKATRNKQPDYRSSEKVQTKQLTVKEGTRHQKKTENHTLYLLYIMLYLDVRLIVPYILRNVFAS